MNTNQSNNGNGALFEAKVPKQEKIFVTNRPEYSLEILNVDNIKIIDIIDWQPVWDFMSMSNMKIGDQKKLSFGNSIVCVIFRYHPYQRFDSDFNLSNIISENGFYHIYMYATEGTIIFESSKEIMRATLFTPQIILTNESNDYMIRIATEAFLSRDDKKPLDIIGRVVCAQKFLDFVLHYLDKTELSIFFIEERHRWLFEWLHTWLNTWEKKWLVEFNNEQADQTNNEPFDSDSDSDSDSEHGLEESLNAWENEQADEINKEPFDSDSEDDSDEFENYSD